MKKMKLEKGNSSRDIDIEYDETRYSIEHVKAEGKILLKRLSNSKVIKIFDDHLGFIVQVDKDGETHFLVSSYGRAQEYDIKFQHYIDYKYKDILELKADFENDCIALSKIRITDSAFVVERENTSANLYNLKGYSKRFENLYNDGRIKALFGANDKTIMVSEMQTADSNPQIYDIITYGINPETYEIATPIWSEDQQRFIPIYSEEELARIEKKQYVLFGRFLNRKNYSVLDIMIEHEIRRFLNMRNICTERPKSVYKDNQQIDEEFVRSFVKKQ